MYTILAARALKDGTVLLAVDMGVGVLLLHQLIRDIVKSKYRPQANFWFDGADLQVQPKMNTLRVIMITHADYAKGQYDYYADANALKALPLIVETTDED